MGRQLVYALANSNVNSLLLTYFNLEKTLSTRKICDETLPKYMNKILLKHTFGNLCIVND